VDVPDIRGYGILSPVGTGAGSVIYKAIHQETGGVVAVKWVARRSRQDDRYVRQAENEWSVCSRLEHFNVVQVRELIKLRDLFWLRGCALVMEFIDGVRLAECEQLPLAALVECFLQTARALEHIHQGGYAHCDLKPQNILLRSDGVVKLVDFGIAAALGRPRERAQGTVNFIAPEQTEPGEVDRRTDIFGLGATMYRMLTGHTLPTTFLVDTRSSVQPSQRLWSSITKLNREVPEPLAELVLACIQRRLQERPTSAGEVVERLSVILAGLAASESEALAKERGP